MDNDPNNPLFHQIAATENAGKAQHGETHWNGAMKGVQNQMLRNDDAHVTGGESLTQADLLAKISRPDGAARLFSDGMANADEETWRRWRDSLPHRKRRIQQAGG
jgi:hypothetical protein